MFDENTCAADLAAAFDAPPPTANQVNLNRRKALEELYISTYPSIREAASDSTLIIADIESIASGVATHLDSYSGSLDPESFQHWAIHEAVIPAVERVDALHALYKQHSKAVFAGIWSVLKGCDGLGVEETTAAELAQNTWLKVLHEWDKWKPSTKANYATRLRQAGYWQARAWKTSRCREKERYSADEPMPYATSAKPRAD